MFKLNSSIPWLQGSTTLASSCPPTPLWAPADAHRLRAQTVIASRRALSLLSTLSADTPVKFLGHKAMQPEPSPSTQSWILPGFHPNRTAAIKSASPVSGPERSMDATSIHHQGMDQVDQASQNPTPPLWWEQE